MLMDFPILNNLCIPGIKTMILVNDGFAVFLDLVSENFEYFCIDMHKGNWSEVLFLCCSSCGFGISVIVAS